MSRSPLSKTLYALGLIPYTLFALFMAVSRFPRYADQRRCILGNSTREQFWLPKELWKRRHPRRMISNGDSKVRQACSGRSLTEQGL